MRSLRLAGACAVGLLLCACGGGSGGGDDGDDGGSGGGGTPGKVTVTNGFADGFSAVGDTVHVFANPSTPSSVFDHWSGDTSGLADAHAWHTTFTLSSSNVALTAVYASVVDWTPVEDRIGSEDFWYHVPSSPVGVIFFFHGRGGTGPQWFKDPEFAEFLEQAVAKGYGVAALDASDHVGRAWTLEPESTSNPDVQNIQTAIARLKSAGLITSSTPRYAVGFSNGAGMSVLECDLLGCDAQALVSAQGGPVSRMESTSVPTRFNLNEHDSQSGVDNTQADTFSADMIDRGVHSQVERLQPSPVYEQRFARVPGLTATDSQAIFQALDDGGFLDDHHFLKQDPSDDASGWEEAIPPEYTSDPLTLLYLSEEMDNAFSAHDFYSDALARTVGFFAAQ